MRLFITDWTLWTAAPDNPDMEPGLPYVAPLFRRRLSQISKITIHVIHQMLEKSGDIPIIFVSSNGESSRQMQINRMLISDGEVLPAAFSFSVFNTPPAAASIALKLSAGYSAVYPDGNILEQGFICGSAHVLSGDFNSILLVFADEKLLPEYAEIATADENVSPYGAAFILSSVDSEEAVLIDIPDKFAVGNMLPVSDVISFVSLLNKKRTK